MTTADGGRFGLEDVVLGGVSGERIEIESANPRNYFEAIGDPRGCERITIDGQLFRPAAEGAQPVVIVVPGSLGVGPNHRAHAETLVRSGYAVFVLDPFGARSVSSTVANQTQYSFAASAFDVLATVRVLSDDPTVDAARISAQGHSRGGSAVMVASMRRFADAVLGPGRGLAGSYAVYPWCGHQFIDADVGTTIVRAIMGDLDEWCSVQQVQAQVAAIAAAGGASSMRLVAGAHHSFDRYEAVHAVEGSSVAPAAPTAFIRDDGAMVDPWSGRSDVDLTDRDLFLSAVRSGFGRRDARIGGLDGQPEIFTDDMLSFHAAALGREGS